MRASGAHLLSACYIKVKRVEQLRGMLRVRHGGDALMVDELDTKRMWKSIGTAIGVEIREATSIRGISGQDHAVQAVGVDEKTNRVVIFSAEPSPRIAALMQTDVQATMTDAHVLVARPVIFDLAEIARRIVSQLGGSDLQKIGSYFKLAADQKTPI
jgi:hypothetical protein